MAAGSDWAAFAHKLDRTSAEFSGTNLHQVWAQLGKAAEGDAAKAAAADLGGDDTFSGWSKNPLVTESKPVADGVVVRPRPRARGAWRVAQSGRHQGAMRVLGGGASGPVLGQGKISAKTGKALGKNKRWNGSTDPKDTWDDAVEIMQRETPARAERAIGLMLGRVWG